MDHAQEVGLWRAVGELEGEITALKAETAEIRESHITTALAVLLIGTAFFAGMVAAGMLMRSGPLPALRPSIFETSEPQVIDRTPCEPAGWGTCGPEKGEFDGEWA